MAEDNLKKEDLDKQQAILQDLVNTAFHQGLVVAIDKARKMNDPYVVDAFHDLLVDRLYNELVKRDKLEEL